MKYIIQPYEVRGASQSVFQTLRDYVEAGISYIASPYTSNSSTEDTESNVPDRLWNLTLAQ